jgi:hypothetical protein
MAKLKPSSIGTIWHLFGFHPQNDSRESAEAEADRIMAQELKRLAWRAANLAGMKDQIEAP